ncbi:MAG TPA: dihydrofolate reductase [Thermoanaerobaculia bacterium]|jgi:dihydrofolate reductase|nr:dihydrofolate reductase [Thermoanaerobaculia bacterium]
MRLSIIVAVATNGVIGRDNKLPWHLSTDLKRFKTLTSGHTVIMGRKTFDEIGRKPLPNRTNIVVSRGVAPAILPADVLFAASVDEALSKIPRTDEEAFIIGGAEIVRQTMTRADRMYITQVHADVPGDTFMPEFDDVNEWRLVDREDFEADAKNDYPFSFLIYDRVAAHEEKAGYDEQG